MISGRRLTCVDCGEVIEVFEYPVPWCDPETFRCVFCLDPRHRDARAQLELVLGALPPRAEVRNYDPAQARIPY